MRATEAALLATISFALAAVITTPARGAVCGNGACEGVAEVSGCRQDCPFSGIRLERPRIFFTPADFARFRVNRTADVELLLTWPGVEATARRYAALYDTRAKVHDLVWTFDLRFGETAQYIALAAAVTGDAGLLQVAQWFVEELLPIPVDYGSDYNQGSKIEALAYILDYLYDSLVPTTRAEVCAAIGEQLSGPNLLPSLLSPSTTGGHSKSIHFRCISGMLACYGEEGGPNTSALFEKAVGDYFDPNGYLDTYEFACADGGHYFGPAYGASYSSPVFEILWDIGTWDNETKATRSWLQKFSLWYIYSQRHRESTQRVVPLAGDTWDYAVASSQEHIAWAARNFDDPYLAWYMNTLASHISLGIWGLIGNFVLDNVFADDSPEQLQVLIQDSVWSANSGVDGFGAVVLDDGKGVSVPQLGGINFPQKAATVSFWVHGAIFNATTDDSLFDGYTTARDHLFVRCTTKNYVQFVAQNTSTYVASIGIYPSEAGLSDEWHMIAITFDSDSHKMTAFIDGFSKTTTLSDPSWTPNGQLVLFGKGLKNGILDEATIFDVALPVSQLEEIYQRGKIFTLSAELVAVGDHWKVCAIPFDGTAEGEASCSATIEITASGPCGVVAPSEVHGGITVAITPNMSSSCAGSDFTASVSGGSYRKVTLMWLRNETGFSALLVPFDAKPPGLASDPAESLPVSASFPRAGFAFLKTSWNWTDFVHVTFKAGQFYTGNHQHLDQNTFAVYYRSPLLVDSGNYQPPGYGAPHFWNYYQRTIAHNGILVFDESETIRNNYCNDGGQEFKRDYPTLDQIKPGAIDSFDGGIVAFREQDEFSFVRGDETKAYASSKVSHFTRDLLLLRNANGKYPVLVVFDRVKSTNASFTKTFLLHSINEPDVSQSNARVEIAYELAKLSADVLLPMSPQITTLGGAGKEYMCGGTNWAFDDPDSETMPEAGKWRAEISPSIPAELDHFLVAMDIMENVASARSTSKRLVQSDLFFGVVVDAKTAILFAKSVPLATGQNAQSLAFSSWNTVETVILVGLPPGASYTATVDGTNLVVSEGNGEGSHTSTSAGTLLLQLEPTSAAQQDSGDPVSMASAFVAPALTIASIAALNM